MQTDYDPQPLNGISKPQIDCRSAKLLHVPILTLDTEWLVRADGENKRERVEVTDQPKEKRKPKII
jgi:hypothetical protein